MTRIVVRLDIRADGTFDLGTDLTPAATREAIRNALGSLYPWVAEAPVTAGSRTIAKPFEPTTYVTDHENGSTT